MFITDLGAGMLTYLKVQNFLVKELTVNSRSSISLQKHHHRSEHWMITQGKPKITINKKNFLKKKTTLCLFQREPYTE